MPFYDLDQLIEETYGNSIPALFLEEGEAGFRQKERDVLQNFLARTSHFILATGGGAPCFYDNMERLNAASHTLYLAVEPDEIVQRLHQEAREQRPMFAGLNTAEARMKLQDLLSIRERYYEEAKIKLSTDQIRTEFVIAQLLGLL
ncbi:shikimate kinase [Nitritalea halalkaliphila LW7]|uniref:Shikimate kinase n=1 Tax=Nitritalea halalkaliphila LW7 TaxID=1189621 RepID=I5BY66_9BACT|nr:shikimate kinase [Nitritalea halalkaliphila LW7]